MLNYSLQSVKDLSALQKEEMYGLLASNYNKTDPILFQKDLNAKQLILLLHDENKQLQGFSTLSINPKNSGTTTYNILFSGDTIINPAHWGTQELVRGFSETVGRMLAIDQNKDWYWFLMSKGHRTFMYLPIFFSQYYPNVENKDPDLSLLLNKMATTIFPEYWNKETGLIVFPQSVGELKPELAQGSFAKKRNKHVAFFLEKNPRFFEGEELACITPLTFENIHPRARKYVQIGFDEVENGATKDLLLDFKNTSTNH